MPIAYTWTSASRTAFLISLSVYRLELSPPSERIIIAFRGFEPFSSDSGQINSVQQRSPALGLRECQPVLNLFRVRCERNDEVRAVVELNQEELVFRIRCFEQLRRCLRDFCSLLPMLPDASNTSPIESGASSLENCVISCFTLSSKSVKCSFSRPVTKRLSGSVTVTLMRTSWVSTRIEGSRAACCSSGVFGAGFTRGARSLPGVLLSAAVPVWRSSLLRQETCDRKQAKKEVLLRLHTFARPKSELNKHCGLLLPNVLEYSNQRVNMLHSYVPTPILGVIPARFASSRFPGKALTTIAGKPMIQHVFERASIPGISPEALIIATDDER